MILNLISSFFIELASLFVDMVPYITLGILIAGVMHVVLSKDFVARHIGGDNLLSVFKSALFGVPLPLCSCGVVPTAVYLKNSGASKSAVLSFLISTPQTGIDSIAATWGMLGPLFAFFRAVTALITGMLGGIANFMLDRIGAKKPAVHAHVHEHEHSHEHEHEHEHEHCHCHDHGASEAADEEKYRGFFGKIRQVFDYAFLQLLDDFAVNFLIGLAIAAVISIAVPDDFFAGSFLSRPLVSMLFMVAIGTPMFICSTASIPVAVAMIAKGFSPGAAYVFLVAGPATNAASLAIITKALGKRTAVRYLSIIMLGSLIFGFVMNFLYTEMGISPFGGAEHHIQGGHAHGPFEIAVSIFFLIMLVFVLVRRLRTRIAAGRKDGTAELLRKEESMTRIGIEGMNCSHCSANVEKALSIVRGIKTIDISLKNKCAFVDGDFDVEEAETAIRNAGYVVTGDSVK